MKPTTRKQLEHIIAIVNSRYERGLNDDDLVKKMEGIDARCKGYSFQPEWDTYKLVTDKERLRYLLKEYPHRTTEISKLFISKGGNEYFEELKKQL